MLWNSSHFCISVCISAHVVVSSLSLLKVPPHFYHYICWRTLSFFSCTIIFQTVYQFSFGSPCEMHPPTLWFPVFPLQLNFYVLVPWHCLQPEMWFQTLLPCEHFSGIWQGMAPVSQNKPHNPWEQPSHWVTILPASVKSPETLEEEQRWISKSQCFSQEHNSYVISVFIICKPSNKTQEQWGGRAGWVPCQTCQTAVCMLLVSDTTKACSANPCWQLPFQLLLLVATQGS